MSTILCDPKVWARCPGHEYCGSPADFMQGSECDLYNQKVLAELPVDGWISVKDRLPREEQYRDADTRELIPLLVCVSGTEYPFRGVYDGKNWGDGWAKLDVTFWMPLPEPPEVAK